MINRIHRRFLSGIAITEEEIRHRLIRSMRSKDISTFSSDLRSLKPSPKVIESITSFYQSEMEKINVNIKNNTRNSLINIGISTVSAPSFYYCMMKVSNFDATSFIEGLTNVVGYGSPAIISGGLLMAMPWIILNQTFSTIGYLSERRKYELFKTAIDHNVSDDKN